MSGFWSQGHGRYLKALEQEFLEGLRDLAERRTKAASPEERAEIDRRVGEERGRYEHRIAQADRSLF